MTSTFSTKVCDMKEIHAQDYFPMFAIQLMGALILPVIIFIAHTN